MKKIFTLFVAALTCLMTTTLWAGTVTKDEAIALAGSFFSTAQVTQAGSSANKAPAAGVTNLTTSKFKALDLSASVESDYFYVIQNEDGGWVMMAADDAVQPILAYSETGTFKTNNMPANLKDWLGAYNDQIKYVSENGLTASATIASEWTALRNGARKAQQATTVVGPLITSKWDQDSPYYYYCPSTGSHGQSVVGCVATAMAQVMNFWEWPEKGQGSKTYTSYNYGSQSANFANTTYDWANMKDTYTSGYTTAQRNAVATLSYHCGVAVEMDYDNSANGGSGAVTLNYGSDNDACAQNALWKYFKYDYSTLKSYYRDGYGSVYSSWTESNWIAMLKAELDLQRPIIYSGRGSGGGHCFICDGYDSDNKFHFNWGWSGSNDGFYTVNNLVPGSGGSGGGSYSFTNNQGCIIGIKPVVSDKYKVTYSVTNGTCATPSWTQSTVGQSCTLPNATPNTNYHFLGWTDLAGSKTPNVGKAGDSYTPMRNVTLYAVMIQEASLTYFVTDIEPGFVDHDIQWNAKPNWSGHGSCELSELYEDGEGTGIILPGVNSDEGWTFQQWIIVQNGSLYIAGWPGDEFHPTQDTAYLYAYWTPDANVYLDEELTGVVATVGPFDDLTQTYGWVPQADGLTLKFVADQYYQALTAANTTVSVKVGGETVANCYSFANGTLTITLTPEQMIDDIDVSIAATLQTGWNCSDYAYSYTSNVGRGTVSLGKYQWTITTEGNTTTAYASNGQAFGGTRNGQQCTKVTYVTTASGEEDPSSCLINNIVIRAWCTNAGGTMEAFINNQSLGTATLTQSGAYYTFNNPDNLKGQVKFVINNASNTRSYRIFVRNINFNMADNPDGSMAPGDPITVSRTFMSAGYFDYNEGEGDPLYVWQFALYPFTFTNGQPSGYVNNEAMAHMGIAIANSPTSIVGTYNMPVWALYDLQAGGISEYYDDNEITITYKSKGTGNFSAYYIYHVSGYWYDENGQKYVIDSDVYTELSNFDTDEDITPTGDTTPRYYKVQHWLQNVDGGTDHNATNYTLQEADTETGQGASGETFATYSNSYAGFVSPDDQNVTLANNNTQNNPKVVNYYYDRRTYAVNFIVDHTVAQSDQVRYKATPSYRGSTPQRTATEDYVFTFSGWSPLIAPISQATTYTALFDAHAKVVVTFNANGHGTAPASQTIFEGQTITRPADPTAEGYTFGGWYTEAGCVNAWNFSNPVNASMTLFAKWTVETHTLTWDANGGQLSGDYTSGTVAVGTAITAPTATRQGYTFAGWGATVPATMPNNDLSFTAQWTPNTNTAYKVLHYKEDLSGALILAETENLTGTTATNVTPAVKSYTGFTAPATQTKAIEADGSLVITYNYTRNSYTLTWDANGGNISGSYTSGQVKYEAPITAPANANVTRTGYNFLGWNTTPASTMPATNTTYTAQWEIKTYSGITFTSEDINKGTVSVTGQKEVYNYGDEVTITATPKAGYSFSKWSDNNTTASRTLRIGIDISASLVASFTANTNTPYLVHFFKQNLEDDNYTEQLPAEQCQGTTGTLTNAAEVLKSYPGFTRLDYNEEIIAGDGSTEINVYYDRQTFVIRFLVDGVVKQNQTLRFGATPAYTGAEPTRAATAEFTYTFKNWSPAIATVSQAQDYEAVFNEIRNNYTVTFNANGHATAPAPQNIAYGSKVTEPDALSETGYTFGGWFKEAGCANAWNFSTDVVTGTLELFAKWTINTHRVSWDGNGGTLSGDYTSGNAIEFGTAIVAPTAERAGYHFDGWIPSVPATMPDNDLDFVAQWSANNNTAYTVRHMQENVENSNFTLAEEQTLYGTTDGPTNATAKTYTGFTAQPFSQSTIAGNGSTVIEIQYKRNLYTLAWDENGGDALTGNYTQGQVKFGATITAPNEPTRTGWEFKGWNPAVPATMPADNVTYKATWAKAGDTPYKVEHYKQQLDGTYSATPDEVDNEKGETDSEITPATRNYTGFSAPATQTTTIDAGGNTVVVYQYARNKHSLTWDANGGNLSGSYTEGDNIFFDAAITAPTPSRTGYDFAGWGAEVPAKMPDENLAFVAHWTARTDIAYRIEHKQQNIENDNYTLFEFEDKTGTADATITPAVKNYTGFTAPTALPVTINPDGSLVVVYEYTRNSYSLVWNADGGQIVDNGYTHGSVKFDAPIIAPANPTKAGHTFHAWDKAIPSKMPAEDLTIKAQWTINTFSGITFTSNDEVAGTVSVDNEKSTYEYGDQVNITATENEGYHFEGWSDGNDQANRTITIDENSESLVANFAPNTNTPYVVKHLKQNLENDEYTEVVADRQELEGTTGEKIQINPKNYEGFITPSSQADQIAIAGNGSSVIEYRYERRSFSIEWDANGGELSGEYSQGSLKFEAPITEPGIHRDGHIFKGWNEDVPTTMPARALSFIANWEAEKYDNISFESANEEMGTVSVDPEKDEYSYGESVTITATANDGYTFTGWVDENGDPVSSDPTTTIVIDATTGTVTATFSANTDTKFVIRRFLQNIEDDNFTFLDEEEAQGTTGTQVSPEPAAIPGFETPEVQIVTIAGDGNTAVIYNYIRKKFDLVWNANGGQLKGEFTQGQVKFQAPIVAAEAEWNGHIFLGWLPADIPATMPADNLEFVAQWEAETVEGITFASSDETAGSITVDPEKDVYEVGDVVTVTAEANDGYSFSGWSDGNTDGAEREITIDKNTPDSIVAIFTPNEGKYEIQILLQNIEDDEFTLESSIEKSGKTGDLVEVAEITGFTAPEAQTVTIILNANNVVELRYTRNSYNLVWNADGGIIPEGEFTQGLVKFEAPIVAPADPVREGFNFLGWGNVPATMPAEDLTLTAQWEEAQGIEIVIEGRTIFSDEEIRIYDFNGRDVTGLNGHLGNGMYIVVGGGSAVKIAIQ